ncbi:MAG: xanthine dehydrogenase family protein subunit M [Firmicutes bacterium]|nr:xanthine dehydrogenase family protein subunit M [Bacillota bacterium]
MIMSSFDYLKPSSLEEASKLLLENKNSRILAGGTDLLIRMRGGEVKPEKVIDIKNIAGLHEITWEDGRLVLGAAVTWTRIKEDAKIAEHFPALTQASAEFGCYDVRNRATIGGNIANAAPGSECGSPLLIYNADVIVYGPSGERSIPIDQVWLAPGRTNLAEGEFITKVSIPLYPASTKSAYRRISRVEGQDLATCAIAVMISNPEEIAAREVRIALSAVSKTPMRAAELESFLSGKAIDGETINFCKSWMHRNLYPRASSLRGTPEYKKIVLGNLLEDILREFGVLAGELI